MFLTKFCLIILALEFTDVVSAEKTVNSSSAFRFANIYGDHMVLQAKPFSAMVWGFGEIGQTVDVRLGSTVHTTKVIRGKCYLGCQRGGKSYCRGIARGILGCP